MADQIPAALNVHHAARAAWDHAVAAYRAPLSCDYQHALAALDDAWRDIGVMPWYPSMIANGQSDDIATRRG